MKIAVIGAGATGLSAARFLCEAKHQVTVFEQFEQGHSLGSSHGTSRITRKTYADPFYTALMEEVFPLWLELEQIAHQQFYVQTGILFFGVENSDLMKACRHSLIEHHVSHDVLTPVETARKFDGFHLRPDEIGLIQYEAGYLRAERILQFLTERVIGLGGKIKWNTKASIDDSGCVNGVDFDAIVVCAGSWVKQFVDIPVVPHKQLFAYFKAPPMPRLPVWVEASDQWFYGVPDYGRGFKVGLHEYGPAIEPSDLDRSIDSTTLLSLRAYAAQRLHPDVELISAHSCIYTVEKDEDFQIGMIPCKVPTYYVSGCSGHGFKFTVWFGWLIREFIEGRKTPADYPKFGVKT